MKGILKEIIQKKSVEVIEKSPILQLEKLITGLAQQLFSILVTPIIFFSTVFDIKYLYNMHYLMIFVLVHITLYTREVILFRITSYINLKFLKKGNI